MDMLYQRRSRLFVLLLMLTACVEAPRPFVNHPTCPRQPELARGRHCAKKCLLDEDCKSKRKCLCDFPCGMSCVKSRTPCPQLGQIENGHLVISDKPNKKGNHTFGTRIRFTCLEGFVLSGRTETVCGGDGRWSAQLPTCETKARCQIPPWVPYASIRKSPAGVALFPLGTELHYECETGYIMHGFNRAKCVGEGRWWGPKMSCSPITCGHPGNIDNSDRRGNVFVYPFQVKYVCHEGYRLLDTTAASGHGARQCLVNGQWSGRAPICHPIKCPRLARPANGTIQGLDRAYGGVAYFYCNEGFKLIGSPTRKCRMDGTWTGKNAYCEEVDCGIPGPLHNGYLEVQGTTYKSIITFKCKGRTTFEGKGIETMCQQNGSWSIGVPKCWNKCQVPVTSGNTIDGAYIDHGIRLKYPCPPGQERNTTEDPFCHNGTWTIPPICVPESCKMRPKEIRDGHVRFYTMQHGDRARYKCNTGFHLVGPQFVTCGFGVWRGRVPICAPISCEHPGTLEHGSILLVGVIGKYDYKSYVSNIWHNRQIEFQCDTEYKRVGPGGATCVGGKWSPSQLPKCVQKHHPKMLYIFRGKRSLVSLPDTSAPIDPWKDKGLCEVPSIVNSATMNLPPGYYVPHSSQLEVTCLTGYNLEASVVQSLCNDGLWTWIPECIQ